MLPSKSKHAGVSSQEILSGIANLPESGRLRLSTEGPTGPEGERLSNEGASPAGDCWQRGVQLGDAVRS